MKISFLLFFISIVGVKAHSADKSEVTNEDFRCETMMGVKLAEFKAKLLENCNLNLPFSSSMSRVLSEEAYFYCCQKKK